MYSDDEKHGLMEGEVVEVYEVELEAAQPKPKRPLWRRFLRFIVTFFALFMIWSTLIGMMPNCTKKQGRVPGMMTRPEQVTSKPKTKFTFAGDLADFKIKQVSQSTLPTRTEVFGKVVVGSCPKAENISVYFDIHVSDDALWDKISIEPKSTGIVFSGDAMSIVKQSVNITAFVVVPSHKDYKLSTFQVETRELDIKLAPSFRTVVNGTYFETISGNIASYGHDVKDVVFSPFLAVKSVSGSIYGRYPLGKTLSLETGSGMIGVNISSAPMNEVEAKFKTNTVSGNNYVTFATDLHPRPLLSSHKSVSGNVKVHYPEDWQGKMRLESVSGDIDVSGEGTKIVKKKNGATGRFYKAIKGDGKSRAFLGTVSGDVAISVGKPEPEDD